MELFPGFRATAPTGLVKSDLRWCYLNGTVSQSALAFRCGHGDVSRSGEPRYKYQYFLVHSLEILELSKWENSKVLFFFESWDLLEARDEGYVILVDVCQSLRRYTQISIYVSGGVMLVILGCIYSCFSADVWFARSGHPQKQFSRKNSLGICPILPKSEKIPLFWCLEFIWTCFKFVMTF